MSRVDYGDLAARRAALTEGEGDAVARMATLACEIHHADDRFHWTAFYRNVGTETLKIGPCQGGHGCRVSPFSRGVCGAAARTGATQVVDDVAAFPGHIACAAATRSEIVLPVWRAGAPLAVLDIDIGSDRPAAFGASDEVGVTAILEATFGP